LVGVQRHEHSRGAIVVDDRWFPILIGTWFGESVSSSLDVFYRFYDEQLDRAAAEGIDMVLVTDALDVLRPSSEIRERFARETALREPRIQRHVLGSIVATRGGVVQAVVAWLVHRRRGLWIASVRDMPAALERALAKLDQAGVPRPLGLDPRGYERPPRSLAPMRRQA